MLTVHVYDGDEIKALDEKEALEVLAVCLQFSKCHVQRSMGRLTANSPGGFTIVIERDDR